MRVGVVTFHGWLEHREVQAVAARHTDAEAAIAANYAKNYLDPKSRIFPGHSSERDK